MDLDDSFAERLLSRRNKNAAFLNAKKAESSTVFSKKRAALVDEQQFSNEGDATRKESPKRQCTSKEEQTGKENIDMEDDEPYVPFKAKGLAALRRKNANERDQDEDCSPPATLRPEVNKTYIFSTNSSDLCTTRKTRLNTLAANINQWEDDLSRPLTNSATITAPSNTSSNSFAMKLYYSDSNSTTKESSSSGTEKRPPVPLKAESGSGKLGGRLDVWNQAIKATMETDELLKSPVRKVTKFNEKDSVKDVNKPSFQKQTLGINTYLCPPIPIKEKNVSNINEKKPNDALNKSMDPAELPLSARKALFEKSLFGGNAKSDKGQAIEPKLSIAERAAMFEKATNSKPRGQVVMPKLPVPQQSPLSPATVPPPPPPVESSPIKETVQEVKEPLADILKNSPVKKLHPMLSPSKEASNHVRLVQQQLVERDNWQEKDIVARAVDERKKEILNLLNRHTKSSSSAEDNEEEAVAEDESEEEEAVVKDESDEEEAEEDYVSESERESFDDGIQQQEHVMESNLSDEDADVFNPQNEEVSDFALPEVNSTGIVNNVRNGQQEDFYKADFSDAASKSSSLSVGSSFASNSLSSRSSNSSSSYDSSTRAAAVSSDPQTPLQYTVSFYRKQKQATRTPPLRTIVRREQVESPPMDNNNAQVIQERIKALQDEILRQQTIMGQSSQALNLCHTTAEFSGSSEQVEGERLLLIATQKRQACLNEIQRLKSHGAQRENVTEGAGTLTITDIQLPLKREFISAQLEGKLNDAVHCFLCLIRHGAQVIVTQMVSTDDKISDGSLCFTNHIKLQNLPPDLSVVFEVYALQTRKEQLPHDKKYHIKREQSKIRLTPKGKKAEGKLVLPAITSPGGPNAVRSSSFGVVGFTRFTIQNCYKKCFTLDKVPFSSPLEGVLKVRLQLHAEQKVTEKGFLTMFEVVTGFGAWHRRWCYLNAGYILYWKYPDDEHKKDPIGMIDLKKCVTGQVKLIARDICARPHTFELVMLRPKEKGDKVQGNPLTTTKHLLSADTKEERILWCNKLNEALTNVRKWDPQALRPIETDQSACTFPSSK